MRSAVNKPKENTDGREASEQNPAKPTNIIANANSRRKEETQETQATQYRLKNIRAKM